MLGSVVLSNRNYKYKCLEVWSADKKLGSISNPHHFWRSCWDHEAEPSCSNHDRLQLPKVPGTAACRSCCWESCLLGTSWWPFDRWSGLAKPLCLRGRLQMWCRPRTHILRQGITCLEMSSFSFFDVAEFIYGLVAWFFSKYQTVHLILSRHLWWQRAIVLWKRVYLIECTY